MPATAELADFYEDGYTQDPASAERASRWRALGAKGKADHAIALCARAGLAPRSTLEVGCGDGALLCELHRRGFGGALAGVEIAPTAVAIAGARKEIERVEVYDGRHLPARNGEFELGILSHVLEHVRDPAALLAETARVCRAVVVEVPLEDNLSAGRAAKRAHAAEVGHLHRLSRSDAREIVRDAGLRMAGAAEPPMTDSAGPHMTSAAGPDTAGHTGPGMAGATGLRIAGELEDPLPLEVHRFLASSASAATAKWALRAAPQRLAPGLARRLFTVHYACLCLPR